LLILDNPEQYLTQYEIKKLGEIINMLINNGVYVIVVTKSLDLLNALKDVLVKMILCIICLNVRAKVQL